MAGTRASPRVTVVDDSSEFVELVREALESELTCSVTGFSAPDVTVEQIAASAPDVLIVDLVLGDVERHVSGWELMLLARSHRDLKTVPIVLCTADLAQVRERQEDLASQVNVHVLTKPFGLEEIYGLVQQLLTP